MFKYVGNLIFIDPVIVNVRRLRHGINIKPEFQLLPNAILEQFQTDCGGACLVQNRAGALTQKGTQSPLISGRGNPGSHVCKNSYLVNFSILCGLLPALGLGPGLLNCFLGGRPRPY